MGLLSCCFAGSHPACEAGALREGQGPKAELTASHAACFIPVQESATSELAQKDEKGGKFFSVQAASQSSNGLECALALQALFCTAGRAESLPEARTTLILQMIQQQLGASAVRMYVMGAHSGSGVDGGFDGQMVQLAAATTQINSDAKDCRDSQPASPGCESDRAALVNPMHEPVGTSSMLLRRALVEKTVIHRCEPNPRTARGGLPLCMGSRAPTGIAAVGPPQLGSSAGSASCTQPDADGGGAEASRWGPYLDLCDVDSVPGSPMLYAALPLSYGVAAFAVIWIALPYEAGTFPPPEPSVDSNPVQSASRGSGDGKGVVGGSSSAIATVNSAIATATASEPTGLCVSAGGDAKLPAPVALMCNPAALQQLALSASMALAAGACDPPAHFRRLASALSRLACAASLAELVDDLCAALSRHVRQRFLVDSYAQAALVPGPDSKVAFMLRSENLDAAGAAGGAGAGGGAVAVSGYASASGSGAGAGVTHGSHASNSFSAWAGRQQTPPAQIQNLSRLRMSSVPSSASMAGPTAERSRSVTVTPLAASTSVVSAATSKCTRSQCANELSRAYTTVGGTDAAAAGGPTSASYAAQRPASVAALRGPSTRDVFMLDSSVARSDASFGFMTSNGPVAAPPTLSARAFRLSNTLLQAIIQAATTASAAPTGAAQPPAPGSTSYTAPYMCESGVLPGVCVCDCARHVQDERQPNRDVCMLMVAGGAPDGTRTAAGTVGGANGATSMCISSRGLAVVPEPGIAVMPSYTSGGTRGSSGGAAAAPTCASAAASSGAQSLVLLGLETGDGAVLGLYLALPTPAPHQLLDAVRESCRALLAKVLADLVRHRLRRKDLAAEWDTLRAGVPGAYLSVSRASAVHQDHVHNTAPANTCPSTTGGGGGGGTLSLLSPQRRGMKSPRAAAAAAAASATTPLNALLGSSQDEPGLLMLQPGGAAGLPQGPGSASAPLVPPGGRTVGGARSASGGLPTAAAAVQRGAAGRGVAKGSPEGERRFSHGEHGPLGVMPPGGAEAGAAGRSLLIKSPSLTYGGAEETKRHDFPRLNARGSARSPSGGTSRSMSGRALHLMTRLVRRHPHACDANGGGVESGNNAIAGGAGGGGEEEGGWLDAPAAGGGAPGAATGMLTVHDLDETYESWGMRAHMGALVDSIISTTLRSSGAQCRMDEGAQGVDPAARATEGLEDLQLSAVLGQGASGVVLRGTQGCAPVAVKIMEMPDGDSLALNAKEPSLNQTDNPNTQEEGPGADAKGGKENGAGGAGAEPREVRARRALLRNAMEVALMRSISHVNIVQAFGVYDNVIMERHEGRQGIINLRRVAHTNNGPNGTNQHNGNSYSQNPSLDARAPDREASAAAPPTQQSPICTAIVMELCDRGSLADVLHHRSFPALALPPPHPAASPAATAGASMQYARYWKGVFMTLLEIALALRHLHSRRLVHRDLKPGNVLLKSSPGDPRGWTCKLADFGFALVLDRVESQNADDTPGVSASSWGPPTPPSTGSGMTGGGVHREWYTVQQHLGGTVTHMAPEAFRKGARIDASVDVFSFGVIMWELVSSRGHRPHRDLELDDIGAAVQAGTRLVFPPGDHVPLSYRQLAKACWSAEPRNRPGAGELVTIIKGMLEGFKA